MRVRAVAYCSLPIVWMTPADRARQATSCELLCRSSTDFDLSSDYAKVIEQSLEYSPDVKAFSEFDALLEKDFQIPFAALRLDVMFSVSLEDLEITSSDPDKFPVTEAVRHSAALHDLREGVVSFFRDVCLATNIARPGSFHIGNIGAFIEGLQPRLYGGSIHALGESLQRSKELRWPHLAELDISQVWKWLERLKSTDSPGARKLRRAVSALTYLFNESAMDEDSLSLVWALAGLESVYGEGNVGSKTQLLTKSEALLGARTENKKKFSWMYDYRSRLLHGDIDFNPSYHCRWLASSDSFDEDTYECQQLAAAILVATLQRCCEKNVFELNFEYQAIYGPRA